MNRRQTLLGLGGVGLSGLGFAGCASDPTQTPRSAADGAAPAGAAASGSNALAGPDSGFRFEGGVGRNSGGPERARYTDAFGRYGIATPSNWWSVGASVDAFSRLDQILPSSTSAPASSGSVRALSRAAQEPALVYNGAGPQGSGRFNLDDYCARNPVTGLLIARQGHILVERYQYDRGPIHRMTSFSMAKTLIAMLTGLAVAQGRIRSIDDPAERYALALRGTEYGRTPLRHLLTMSSGVRFREEYDGTDDSALLSRRATGRQSAGGAEVVRPFNQRIAPPGQQWNYASAETFVLALATREAFGESLAAVFSRDLWQPLGAQSAGAWLTDRSGLEIGYMGFNATLSDWARLAMMMADGGRVGSRQILPADWLDEMTRMQVSPQQTRRYFGYGYQTWIFPERDGSYAFQGVRGQAIYVYPARQIIMVHTAVRPDARDRGGADATALWRAVKTI